MRGTGSLETPIFFLFRHSGSPFSKRESAPAALKTPVPVPVPADGDAAHSIFG